MAKAGIVYVGTNDGVVILSDPASIGRWRRVGHELGGMAVRSLLAHTALSVDVALAGAGVRHSEDGGQSWRATGDGDVALLASHPAAPATLFAATAGGALLRSDDGGASWATCPQGDRPAEAVSALLIDPHSAQRVLVGLEQSGVWASPDGGQRWDALGAGLPAGIERIAASPNRPGQLFAVAGGTLWGAGEAGLWAAAAGPLAAAPGGALALLPGQGEALLVATLAPDGTPGIVRSTDDGATWQPAPADEPLAAPVTAIAPATYHIDTAWAGTADGRLLLSDDRGRTWRTIARDLAPVTALAAVRLA